MKISDNVLNKVNKLRKGYIFTVMDFDTSVRNSEAVIKVLNRMVNKGKLKRTSKGRYYKPKQSEFGELKPYESEIIKDLLDKDGKPIGYISGYSLFNSLGLTTQVPFTIQIAVNKFKKPIERGFYKIRFLSQPNRITKENIPVLQILDAVRFIKTIPDSSVDSACFRLKTLIEYRFSEKEKIDLLIKCALKYNSATRSLTGAILESIFNEDISVKLYESLNPSTKYNFNISENVLLNKKKWRIS